MVWLTVYRRILSADLVNGLPQILIKVNDLQMGFLTGQLLPGFFFALFIYISCIYFLFVTYHLVFMERMAERKQRIEIE